MGEHYIPIKSLSAEHTGMQATITFAIPKADVGTKTIHSKTIIDNNVKTNLASKLVIVKRITPPCESTYGSPMELDNEINVLTAIRSVTTSNSSSIRYAQYFTPLLLSDSAHLPCW